MQCKSLCVSSEAISQEVFGTSEITWSSVKSSVKIR